VSRRKPSLVDRALRVVGLARVGAAPRVRIFNAAQKDRLTEDFFSGTTSANSEIKHDLRSLRNRSRTMVRDSAVAKRYCGLFAENVAGEKGIQLAPRPLTPQGEVDQALRDQILEAWRRFGLPEHCTADASLGLPELQQAIARLEPMDGEVVLQLVDGPGRFGFQVQLLDPDQLDETLNVEPSQGKPLIRQGVELDAAGRPVAYHLWQGHPKDTNRGQRVRVPAADIVHYFEPFRPGAARGIPRLHAAMRAVNMLEGYQEAALVAARVSASAMGHIEDEDDDPEQVEDLPVEMEPGKLFRSAGKVTLLDPKHPTTAFGEFVRNILRSIAMAGGVSYTSLSGDLEAVNYSSIRAGLLSERDFYRMQQQRMIRFVLRRIYERWLRMAQLSGELPITAAQLRAAERVEWQPRGFPWVDPLKDKEALRLGISLGVDSRTDAAADAGHDFETILETLAEEQKLATQYGVDVSGIEPVMPAEAANESQPPARGRMRLHG
jgi:lambda family phage portal protein